MRIVFRVQKPLLRNEVWHYFDYYHLHCHQPNMVPLSLLSSPVRVRDITYFPYVIKHFKMAEIKILKMCIELPVKKQPFCLDSIISNETQLHSVDRVSNLIFRVFFLHIYLWINPYNCTQKRDLKISENSWKIIKFLKITIGAL